MLISDFIGRIKGGSAHDLNALPQWRKAIAWQSGYGVVVFGTQFLPWVNAYVDNQKEHHAKGTTVDRLERTSQEDDAQAKTEKPGEPGSEDAQQPPSPPPRRGPNQDQAR